MVKQINAIRVTAPGLRRPEAWTYLLEVRQNEAGIEGYKIVVKPCFILAFSLEKGLFVLWVNRIVMLFIFLILISKRPNSMDRIEVS
jgi:hypothetical protein